MKNNRKVQMIDGVPHWHCKECDSVKPQSEFYMAWNRKCPMPTCINCMAAQRAAEHIARTGQEIKHPSKASKHSNIGDGFYNPFFYSYIFPE